MCRFVLVCCPTAPPDLAWDLHGIRVYNPCVGPHDVGVTHSYAYICLHSNIIQERQGCIREESKSRSREIQRRLVDRPALVLHSDSLNYS